MSDRLDDDRFPLSNKYDADWLTAGSFGANPIWLAEWLCGDAQLEPGMIVLDLGCGRAKSSVFLAREFGVKVVAADLWVSPSDNWATAGELGVQDLVSPLHADARNLPFPHRYFDAIVAFDSWQYYGTDSLFLPYILQFLKTDGLLGFASAGLVRAFDGGVPNHLERFWTSDAWCLHSSSWWHEHWQRTQMCEIEVADTMEGGWKQWRKWALATECSDWYIDTLEQDAGQYLGYVRMLARPRSNLSGLPYDLRTGQPLL